MLSEDFVVYRHGARDKALWIVRCLAKAEQGDAIGEIDVQLDRSGFTQLTGPGLRAQGTVGDVVNETRLVVLGHSGSQVRAEPPLQSVQIVDLVLRRKTAEDRESSAAAKQVQNPL